MSEFSESFHLKSDQIADAKRMLLHANTNGFVSRTPCNGWVSIVVDGEPFSEHADFLAHNDGILFQYMFAEDFGLGFALYDQKKLVSNYWCGFDEETGALSIDNTALNLIQFVKLLDLSDRIFELNALLSPSDPSKLLNMQHKLCEIIGLSPHAYEWNSYEFQLSLKDQQEQSDMIEVIVCE